MMIHAFNRLEVNMKRISILLSLCLILFFVGSAAAKTTFISIGTGGTGGIYYPYGGGVAEIWSKYVPGIRAVAEVTGASVENVKLAHKGETVIGESTTFFPWQSCTRTFFR
jgi:TRAP-type uncharacterized transport system substrate-binding protein